MKNLKKIVAFALCICMVMTMFAITQTVPVEAATETETKSRDTCFEELISYHHLYGDAAETDIQRLLDEIEKIDAVEAKAWREIMAYWGKIKRNEVHMYIDTVPEGLPNDDSVAIIVNNGKILEDMTLGTETQKRAQLALDIANAYPNAYVVSCSGAAEGNDWSVAYAMGKWLTDNGLDPNRLILQEKSVDTLTESYYSLELLNENYPSVTDIVMVTSDYHIQRACLDTQAIATIQHYQEGNKEINVVGAACTVSGYLSDEAQENAITSNICRIAGIGRQSAPRPVELSVLRGLEITHNSVYTTGNELDLTVTAYYDTGYSRVVTDYTVTEFDITKDANQTITISYTENDVTITSEFTLSETSKYVTTVREALGVLIEECDRLDSENYTAETYEILEIALNNAKELYANKYATDKEIETAYDTLRCAVDCLVEADEETRENVALGGTIVEYTGDFPEQINDGIITATGNIWKGVDSGENYCIIELVNHSEIETIKVYPYWYASNRYYTYEVYLSENLEDWTLVVEYTDRTFNVNTEAGHTYELATPTKANYLKIVATGWGNNLKDESTKVIYVNEIEAYGHLIKEEGIDLTAYNEAIKKVPSDLSVYTAESVVNLKLALIEAQKELVQSKQTYVDAATAEIEKAVGELTYKNADYTAVYEALETIPANLSTYTDETANALNDAVAAVIYGLDITKQEEVDAMATTITDAVKALRHPNVALNGAIVEVNAGMTNASKLNNGIIQYRGDYWSGGAVNGDTLNYCIIELQGYAKLNTIKVYPYYGATNRWYNYDVYVSDDLSDWTRVVEYTDKTMDVYDENGQTYELDTPVYGRYLKLVGIDSSVNKQIWMCEIEAYGYILADYAVIDAAIASIPSDLSIYADVTVETLKDAVATVIYNLDITKQEEVNAMAKAIDDAVKGLLVESELERADYTKVEEAIASIPSDLSIYTDETVNALKDAVAAVIYDLDITKQEEVDAMATTIADAVKALRHPNVALNGAIVEFTGKNATQINDGIIQWRDNTWSGGVVSDTLSYCIIELQGYAKLNTIKVYPYYGTSDRWYNYDVYVSDDLSNWTRVVEYTDKTMDVYDEDGQTYELDMPVYGRYLKLVGTDSNVDKRIWVCEIEAYGYILADYAVIDAAKASIPSDLSIYTDETVKALNDAVAAVIYDLGITKQEEVNAMAKAIDDAVKGLIVESKLERADYTKVEEAIASIPSDLSIYTDETVKALNDAVAAVIYDLDITKQEQVDAVAAAINDAVKGLEKAPTIVPDDGSSTSPKTGVDNVVIPVITIMALIALMLGIGLVENKIRNYEKF